jgi:hypothetical protein
MRVISGFIDLSVQVCLVVQRLVAGHRESLAIHFLGREKVMKSSKNIVAGAFGLGIMSIATGAQAASVLDLISVAEVADIIGSDEDRETLIKGLRNTDVNRIEVGDLVRGIFYIDQLFVAPESGGVSAYSLEHTAGNSELSGVFEVVVASKTLTSNPDGISGNFDDQYAFIYAPSASFDTLGVGTMMRMYEDKMSGTTHFDIDDSVHTAGETAGTGHLADAEMSVTDGDYLFGLGLANASNSWIAVGNDRTDLPFSPVARIGDAFFALNRTEAGTGSGLYLQSLLNEVSGGIGEVIGTTEVGPKIPGSPWALSSNAQFQLKVIPVPAAIWGGLSLLGGMVVTRRVRRSA